MLTTLEILLTDELFWEEMGVGSRRHRHWGPGTKARDSVLRYIKILDSQCDENHNPNVFQVLES